MVPQYRGRRATRLIGGTARVSMLGVMATMRLERATAMVTIDFILDEARVEAFAATLRGQLLRPADDDYEKARIVWNGNIDRRPAFIARCTGVADVIEAVNFARTNQVLVAVRGGGHNAAKLDMALAMAALSSISVG